MSSFDLILHGEDLGGVPSTNSVDWSSSFPTVRQRDVSGKKSRDPSRETASMNNNAGSGVSRVREKPGHMAWACLLSRGRAVVCLDVSTTRV